MCPKDRMAMGLPVFPRDHGYTGKHLDTAPKRFSIHPRDLGQAPWGTRTGLSSGMQASPRLATLHLYCSTGPRLGAKGSYVLSLLPLSRAIIPPCISTVNQR